LWGSRSQLALACTTQSSTGGGGGKEPCVAHACARSSRIGREEPVANSGECTTTHRDPCLSVSSRKSSPSWPRSMQASASPRMRAFPLGLNRRRCRRLFAGSGQLRSLGWSSASALSELHPPSRLVQ
jgi:hypothetical protein